MTRSPDTPCTICGRLTYTSHGSLPPGQRICRRCRVTHQIPTTRPDQPTLFRICPTCDAEFETTNPRKVYCSPQHRPGWHTPNNPDDPRHTRAWRKLRDQVVDEEPECWLHIPGICTGLSETADHVLPFAEYPELALERSNLRGVCHPCNLHRLDTPVEDLPVQGNAALEFFT